MKVEIGNGLSDATKAVLNMPGVFARARRSTLGSIGWYTRQELRNHVEYGGTNWPARHPMTAAFYKKRGVKGGWAKRRSAFGRQPLSWLGKFARYRVDKAGTVVSIDFGKSRSGQPGTFDESLKPIVRRAEQGERIQVTPAMRRLFGATRRKRPREQTPGETYFPLRKETTALVTPKRPIFGPVFNKVSPHIPRLFEEKFTASLRRNLFNGRTI